MSRRLLIFVCSVLASLLIATSAHADDPLPPVPATGQPLLAVEIPPIRAVPRNDQPAEYEWWGVRCEYAEQLHASLEWGGYVVEDGFISVIGSGRCAILARPPRLDR